MTPSHQQEKEGNELEGNCEQALIAHGKSNSLILKKLPSGGANWLKRQYRQGQPLLRDYREPTAERKWAQLTDLLGF